MFLVDQHLCNFTKVDPRFLFTVSETNRYWTGGIPEQSQINWMCETFGSNSAAALDIGAHCGTWTVALAKSFGSVMAFEPNKTVHNVLCANLALRQLENVNTSHKALSSTNGSAEYFYRSPDGGGNGIERLNPEIDAGLPTCTVKKITLDEFVAKKFNNHRIAFIKIDVEGHELDVLKGATETIGSHKPAIVVESWGEFRENDGIPSISLRKELFGYIESQLNYKIRGVIGHSEMFLCTPI